ncbi:cupin domain-containing protein [Maribacter sp. CXY002]|uniref:cupin domain-containing protein n=1 Tax=Maribacter luteocoastalis TaxID=3407671 RepID=UPI003B66D19D
MDRKKFIKATGLGLGMSLLAPQIINSKLPTSKILEDDIDPKIIKNDEGKVLNVIGDIQTHKILGSETGNQIMEWVDDVEPGAGIPPHIHTKEDEIFRIIKGTVEIMVDGKTNILSAGDVAFAPKNIPHSWKVVGTEKAKMITSAFPAGIELMFNEIAELPAGPPDLQKVGEICGRYGISFV